MKTRVAGLLAAVLLSGCGSAGIVRDDTLKISSSTSIALEKIVNWGAYAGVAYWVLDPLTPNWEIEEAKFPNDAVHLSLRMKRYYAGGAGEARAVFHRRAKELARSGGYAGYEVLEYTEGLESSVRGSQRTAAGVVQLIGKPLG